MRWAPCAFLALVPLGATSFAQDNGPGPGENRVEMAANVTPAPAEVVPFEAAFAEIIPPVDPTSEGPNLMIPPDAVDLNTFEPPLEETLVVRSLGIGVASYYGRRFHGRRTANGEIFDMNAMTAAHKTLPFGTLVRVTNISTGRSVTVRINDRGPFIRGRTIDLSRAAAARIGMIASGHARVEMEIVSR